MTSNIIAISVAAAFAVLGGASGSVAQDFPNRPLTMIVPFDPGGGSDAIARAVDKFAPDVFGNNFTFQYRPGAGGLIGTNSIARARPDGYTIGTFNSPHIAIGDVTGTAQFTLNDFTYLGAVAVEPYVLFTSGTSTITSVEDLIRQAKEKPGTITIGTGDQFGGTHLLALQIAEAAGIDVVVVPFGGGAQITAAVLGGHVNIGVAGMSALMGSRSESRWLGVAAPERDSNSPETPTLRESGVVVDFDVSRIFIAPAGLDAEVAETLRVGLKEIYENEDFQAELIKLGQYPKWVSGDDLKLSLEGYEEAAVELFGKARQ